MTDDELRAAYAVHLRRNAAPTGASACVSPEALLALVRGEGAETERLAVLDHVMGCARCRADFDLLRAVTAAGPEAEPGAEPSVESTAARDSSAGGARWRTRADVRPIGRSWSQRRWPAAIGALLAASIVLVVGVGRFRGAGDATLADVARDAGGGVSLVAPASRAVVRADAPVRLVWRSVRGATRYEVEVFAPDGAPVVSTRVADTVVDARGGRPLTPGATYGWWVRALAEDGSVVQQSEIRNLRVASP